MGHFQVVDVTNLILSYLDYESIINFARTHKQALKICYDNKVFWREKAQKDFGISFEEFNNTKLSSPLRYLQIATENGYVCKGAERFLTGREFAKRAIYYRRSDLLLYAIDIGFKNWKLILKETAKTGDKNSTEEIIKITRDSELAAKGALEGKHKELFSWIYSSMNNHNWDWLDLLKSAARSGDKDLFDDILTIVSKHNEIDTDDEETIEEFLEEVLENGHKELYEHINNSLSIRRSWQNITEGAAISNDINLFDDVLSTVPQGEDLNWCYMLSLCIMNNHKNMFDHILGRAPKMSESQWNDLLYCAAATGNRKLIYHIINSMPRNIITNFDDFALGIIIGGNFQLLYEFLCCYKVDWTKLLQKAITLEDLWTFNNILRLVPFNYILNWSTLVAESIAIKNKDIFYYIFSLVPTNCSLDWTRLINEAINNMAIPIYFDGNLPEFLLSKIQNNHTVNWNYLLSTHVSARSTFNTILKYAPLNYRWDHLEICTRNTDPQMGAYLRSLLRFTDFMTVFPKIVRGEILRYEINKLLNFTAKPGNVFMSFYDNRNQIWNAEVKINSQGEIDFP